jgi:gluconate kinase
MDYTYRGDKLTDQTLKNKPCSAVRRPNGKCIRGANGSMLVVFENGSKHVIIGRRLKKSL